MENLLNAKFLFASLFWGSVGFGYCVYGKKQSAMMPLIGGVLMIGISYVVASWLLMTFLCIAIACGVYWLVKQGY